MTRPPLDEAVAYARFTNHVAECAVCQKSSCEAGNELFRAWMQADRYAARLAETDATGFSLDDEYPAGLA